MATDILKAFEPLFYPKSLAVIGASSDMTKFGNIILSAIMVIGYKGKVYPVNPEAEHGDTHLDAPVHFAEGRRTADALPLDRLIGPAVVIGTGGLGDGEGDHSLPRRTSSRRGCRLAEVSRRLLA